jgi:ABC-type multidrug transport system fused ATPase/permease subunit
MDKGRIVERGTHTELLVKGGLYRMIHDLQLQQTPDNPGGR